MSDSLFNEIRLWMHRNARELELSLWRALYENGSVEDVLHALAPYQNEDGGFGHALEADSWNPRSTPYTTLTALGMLRTVGFAQESHPLFQGALRYFASGAELTEQGWRFSVATNNEYPHAPWWSYDEQANATENIGLTAGIAAIVLTHREACAPVYDRALALATRFARRLMEGESLGEMGLGGLAELMPVLRALGVEGLDYDLLQARLFERGNQSIERDPAKWSQYTVRPSQLIRGPESPFYPGNEALVEKEIDFLLATREPGGVWPITWTWFGLMEQYAPQFAISENWWKATRAMETLAFLRAFGRA